MTRASSPKPHEQRFSSIKLEANFHADLDETGGHLGGGVKRHCCTASIAFLSRAHANPALNADIPRFAVGANDHAEHAVPSYLA